MAAIVLSASAIEDLERIGEFLLENIADPVSVHASIIDAIGILRNHPAIGRKVEATGLRELVISQGRTGYLALYRFDARNDVVRILRVRHQRAAGYRGW